MNIPSSIDVNALGKLLGLAKSLDTAMKDEPQMKVMERALIRTTADGHLTFQVKGGSFWRFFAITLPGREKEYDLGQNLAQLQSYFQHLNNYSEQEIRRAAQGMAMYGGTVIDTSDAIATLRLLEASLNNLIDHIKQKKLRRQTDDERKKNIALALDGMKISFLPNNEAPKAPPQPKKVTRKRPTALSSDKVVDEVLDAINAKIEAKTTYPYEVAYLKGRRRALERCRKEIMLWQNGACALSRELAAFRSVKEILREWDSASPELSQLKQLAQDSRHKSTSILQGIQERLERLQKTVYETAPDFRAAFEEKCKKQLLLVEKELEHLQDDEQGRSSLSDLFRRSGEHYLLQPLAFQHDIQELGHAVANRKSQLDKLEESLFALETQIQKLPSN